MDDAHFWQIIQTAWGSDAKLQEFQTALIETIGSQEQQETFEEKYEDAEMSIAFEEAFIDAINAQLGQLNADDLLQFDRILVRKLYDIDREEIHENTDGSDDGFLYCRGFIVAGGQKYYDAVNQDPGNAMYDWECEAITYISHHMYEEKFGTMPASGISRESFNNTAGWPV